MKWTVRTIGEKNTELRLLGAHKPATAFSHAVDFPILVDGSKLSVTARSVRGAMKSATQNFRGARYIEVFAGGSGGWNPDHWVAFRRGRK